MTEINHNMFDRYRCPAGTSLLRMINLTYSNELQQYQTTATQSTSIADVNVATRATPKAEAAANSSLGDSSCELTNEIQPNSTYSNPKSRTYLAIKTNHR